MLLVNGRRAGFCILPASLQDRYFRTDQFGKFQAGRSSHGEKLEVRSGGNMRFGFLMLVMIMVCGCNSHSQTIVLPSAELSKEQQIAVAREDAEACNCGHSEQEDSASDQSGS